MMNIFNGSPRVGFNFSNYGRNAVFLNSGLTPPLMVQSGTTICGVIYKDGVILGADTRTTEGTIITDKNCAKIFKLADNIYCCGAGVAADAEQLTTIIKARLDLMQLQLKRQVPVVAVTTMMKRILHRLQGKIQACFIIGGFDWTGPHLNSMHALGAVQNQLYVSNGSGTVAATAKLEMCWLPNMEEEDAKELMRQAIRCGMASDLASGSNIDLVVIRDGSAEMLLKYEVAIEKSPNRLKFIVGQGAATVTATQLFKFIEVESNVEEVDETVPSQKTKNEKHRSPKPCSNDESRTLKCSCNESTLK